jgi:hypothetical protein
MGSKIESNNAISPPTHTSYYSSVEVEAILAKAQVTAKQIVIVPEYIKKSGACGGS